MSYKTHNFEDGKALLAEQLNEMDAAIAALYTADNLPNAPVGGGAYRVTLTPVEYDEYEEAWVCEADKTLEEITAARENGMCVTATYPLNVEDDTVIQVDIPLTGRWDLDGGTMLIFSGVSWAGVQNYLFTAVHITDPTGFSISFVFVNDAGGTNITEPLTIGNEVYDGTAPVNMTWAIYRMIDESIASITQAEGMSF